MSVQNLSSIGKLRLQHQVAIQQPSSQNNEFSGVLQQELQADQSVQLSKHAEQRLQQRGVHWDRQLAEGVSQAVDKARQKGANDVVVIGNEGIFVVNVKNNTVVTAMTPHEMKEKVFTNIDSAVFI